MSSSLDLVRSINAELSRGEFSPAEWAHLEIECVVPDGPYRGSWQAKSAMVEAGRNRLRAWVDVRYTADEFRELDGERVLVLSHASGRGRTSVVELRQMTAGVAVLFHIRNGKLTRLVAYFDRDRAPADLSVAAEADGP